VSAARRTHPALLTLIHFFVLVLLAAPSFSTRVAVSAALPLAHTVHVLVGLPASLLVIRHKLHTSLDFRDKISRE
jgi:hypothetical protein